MTQHQRDWFTRFSGAVSKLAGKPVTFAAATATVLLWAATGPLLGFSDAWQLTINTATTIITFLMVFVIQNSQNRDTAALQVKLDELIRATKVADNAMLDLEEMSVEELEQERARFEKMAEKAREDHSNGKTRKAAERAKQAKEHLAKATGAPKKRRTGRRSKQPSRAA